MSPAYERLPLNALRVFEAVAARLSFAEAADALNVTPAAVSQQIKALEDYLQTPLFRRNGRQVLLTPEGAELLPGVRRGLDELEAALQRLRQQRETGTVNISLLSSFLQKWLASRLADLRAALPEVQLRLHTSSEPVDFARTDFHAAIRLGPGNYPGLHSVKIMDDWLVAVVSPAVQKKYGPLPESGDLSCYPLIHGSELSWEQWAQGTEQSRRAQPRGAFIDDSVSRISAAIEGLGYAIARWSLVTGDVRNGRLVLASERIVPFRMAYYFVCPPAYVALPKVAAVREWLVRQGQACARPQDAIGVQGAERIRA